MAKLSIKWQRIISSDSIRRSSHIIGVQQDGNLSIFGGELKPREPVDNKLYSINLRRPTQITTTDATSASPPPRVGSACTTLSSNTFLFSGRSSTEMTPLSEQGALWSLNHARGRWTELAPADPSLPTPEPRSYHAMTNDSRDAVYLHAGCAEQGRLSDLWAFQISSRRWIKLSDAPGKPRGGTSIAFCGSHDLLFRMGGFDGKNEVGGVLDVYNPEIDTWTSKTFEADGVNGPEARSVAALVCVLVAGQSWIVALFGERDPSSLGHQGAGKMLGDVWAWDTKGEQWSKVEFEGGDTPSPRGWFAADVVGEDVVVVHGGLAEDNSRLGDVWVGRLSANE